jgi:hypothetical protein
MKILSFACVALLFLHVSAVADDFVVPIIDKSASGSPLENIGSVTLSETIKDGQSTRSRKIEWTVRNKSPKAIVTVVETLIFRYPSGESVEMKSEYEAFFGPKLVKAGGTISFSDNPSGVQISGASSSSHEPSCEVIARWVQFEDGSTWGDIGSAEELLKNRAAIFSRLKQLDDIYKLQGAEQFALELQKQGQSEVDGYIGYLRREQSKHGTQATIDELEGHLTFADAYERQVHLNLPWNESSLATLPESVFVKDRGAAHLYFFCKGGDSCHQHPDFDFDPAD